MTGGRDGGFVVHAARYGSPTEHHWHLLCAAVCGAAESAAQGWDYPIAIRTASGEDLLTGERLGDAIEEGVTSPLSREEVHARLEAMGLECVHPDPAVEVRESLARAVDGLGADQDLVDAEVKRRRRIGMSPEAAMASVRSDLVSGRWVPVVPPLAGVPGKTAQDRMARRVAMTQAGRVLFVPGRGWFQRDGDRWVADPGSGTRAVLDTLAVCLREAEGMLPPVAKSLVWDVRQCETAAAIGAVSRRAIDLPGITGTEADLR